jgi:hypothetical protein
MADERNPANDGTTTGSTTGSTTGAAMRRALLGRVPPLEYHGTSLLESLELDEGSDLRGAIELDADAVLTPLEVTTRGAPPRGSR